MLLVILYLLWQVLTVQLVVLAFKLHQIVLQQEPILPFQMLGSKYLPKVIIIIIFL